MAKTGKLSSGPRQVAKALFGAALMFFLPQILFAPVAGFQLDRATIIQIVGTLILVALGVWALWQPRPASVVAFLLYSVALARILLGEVQFNVATWFFFGFPELLLVFAVFTAFTWRTGDPPA